MPSLRDWLTRKQKETRRGRAELLLADRAVVWSVRPENRQLPSLLQWFQIRWLTHHKSWTPLQRKMMGRASRYHAVRGAGLALLLAGVAFSGLVIREQVIEQRQATYAAGLVQSLLNADTAQVPAVVVEMAEYRRWVDPVLREENYQATANSRQQLHTSLALLPVDATQVDYLYDRLLAAAPHEAPVIRDALARHKDELLDKLWAVVEKPENGKESYRLRAAAALAKYDPESEKWTTASGPVVDQLASENPVFLGLWMEGFRPIKGQLLAPLTHIYKDGNRRESERTLATNILADFAADQPLLLADLLMNADEKQFAVMFPILQERGEKGLPALSGEIDKKLPTDMPSSDDQREKLAKRQANAAVALLRMNQSAKVWPLLKHSPDPRVRSYLIHRLYLLGAEAGAIVKHLERETDLEIERALILSLGEFGDKEITSDARKLLLPKLQEKYRTANDPGLHAAVEWLLRTWKQDAWLKTVNGEWAADKEQREKRLEGIKQSLTKEKAKTPPRWYVNGQGQTMVVIPGPVEFVMGSPLTEAGRRDEELPHKRRISRSFALAATAVTKEQFLRFMPTFRHREFGRYPAPSCPIGGVIWYEAAAYCNWLSRQEGIHEDQWCYEIKGKETKLRANYLSLSGYRLPTEAEMAYATRAGALTSRYYGETEELLPKYAWYQKNAQEKTWPVGSLKPNDLGLFDVQGNVFTWCQESYKPYPQGDETSNDKEDSVVISSTLGRVLRGGSFFNLPSLVRSADRNNNVPSNRVATNGCRLARTFTP